MRLRRIDNPPNPYLSQHAEWLEPPPVAKLEVYEESAGTVLSRNDSPDIPFTWSVNPYRGCQHACAYCYARPSHEYLEFGAGTDFETKLIVKTNAAEALRKALARPSWTGERLCFSGITDPYQPIEACYGITRACLEVCLERQNPVSVITKSFLVVRDAQLIAELARTCGARVLISIPFADAEACKLIEPQAPSPARRFETVRRLRDAGIPVGVMVAPIIPALTDRDIPRILEQAAAAGAQWAGYIALRLPGSVEQVFVQRIREVMPLRADRILSRLRAIRGGALNESRFGARMRGHGAYWQSICDLFKLSRQRYGLGTGEPSDGAPKKCKRVTPRRPEQLAFDFGREG